MAATYAAPSAATYTANWSQRIWQDLQPTPGRLSAALRIVLASLMTLILVLVLQMPFASIALYFVFVVGRDSPAVSLRSGVFSLLTLTASVAVELAVGRSHLRDRNPGRRRQCEHGQLGQQAAERDLGHVDRTPIRFQ